MFSISEFHENRHSGCRAVLTDLHESTFTHTHTLKSYSMKASNASLKSVCNLVISEYTADTALSATHVFWNGTAQYETTPSRAFSATKLHPHQCSQTAPIETTGLQPNFFLTARRCPNMQGTFHSLHNKIRQPWEEKEGKTEISHTVWPTHTSHSPNTGSFFK